MLNKAKQHTDTHMHKYTDTDRALITSESAKFADQRTKITETCLMYQI